MYLQSNVSDHGPSSTFRLSQMMYLSTMVVVTLTFFLKICREDWPQTHHGADDELELIFLPQPPIYWIISTIIICELFIVSKSYMNAFAKHTGGDTG